MRIAVSGSHRVGKSTLIERLAELLPGYTVVEEPYHLLADDDYDFADPPSTGDFAAQLARSIQEIEVADDDALLDRCPADLLAYLIVGGHDVRAGAQRAREAMLALDLVVFVPIEEPDRVIVAECEDAEQRRAVDETLHDLLTDDDFVRDLLVVHGSVTARAEQVMERLTELSGSPGVSPARR